MRLFVNLAPGIAAIVASTLLSYVAENAAKRMHQLHSLINLGLNSCYSCGVIRPITRFGVSINKITNENAIFYVNFKHFNKRIGGNKIQNFYNGFVLESVI